MRIALALAIVTAGAAVSGCGPEPVPQEPGAELGAGDHYVALGDSYTAAPGIGRHDAQDGCFRSLDNYPHLVAEATGVELVDNSCSGATTMAMAEPMTTLTGVTRKPQLDAIDAGTDLVTLSVGANDFGIYSLISSWCPGLALDDPEGTPCTDLAAQHGEGIPFDTKLERVERRITEVLRSIQVRAPDAIVLVIGYPAFAPEDEPCAQLPIAKGDVPFALRVNTSLNAALSGAAEAVGVTYVDAYAATKGHDMCADDPWIAGEKATGGRKAAPWHPYAQEQQAVADLVLDEIGG